MQLIYLLDPFRLIQRISAGAIRHYKVQKAVVEEF